MVLCPVQGNIIMKQNVLFVLRRVSSKVLGVLVLSALDNRYRMASMRTKEKNIHYFTINAVFRETLRVYLYVSGWAVLFLLSHVLS